MQDFNSRHPRNRDGTWTDKNGSQVPPAPEPTETARLDEDSAYEVIDPMDDNLSWATSIYDEEAHSIAYADETAGTQHELTRDAECWSCDGQPVPELPADSPARRVVGWINSKHYLEAYEQDDMRAWNIGRHLERTRLIDRGLSPRDTETLGDAADQAELSGEPSAWISADRRYETTNGHTGLMRVSDDGQGMVTVSVLEDGDDQDWHTGIYQGQGLGDSLNERIGMDLDNRLAGYPGTGFGDWN